MNQVQPNLGGGSHYSAASFQSKNPLIRRFDPTVPSLILGLVLVVFAGWFGIKNLLPPSEIDSIFAQSTQSEQSSQSDQQSLEEELVVVPVVTSAEIFSWFDDGGDNPDLSGYLVDKAPDTVWRTRYFAGNSFVEGSEIAILLRLQETAPVSQITIDVLGSGGLVDITAPDGDNPRSGRVITSIPLEPQTIITIDPPEELNSIGFVFKELPVDDEGRLRAKISGITVE